MIWLSELAILLEYPHKKAHKISFWIFLPLDFFGHGRYVNELKQIKKASVAICSYIRYFLA